MKLEIVHRPVSGCVDASLGNWSVRAPYIPGVARIVVCNVEPGGFDIRPTLEYSSRAGKIAGNVLGFRAGQIAECGEIDQIAGWLKNHPEAFAERPAGRTGRRGPPMQPGWARGALHRATHTPTGPAFQSKRVGLHTEGLMDLKKFWAENFPGPVGRLP